MQDFDIFFNERLNVNLDEYFNLEESDKKLITDYIIKYYSQTLDKKPILVKVYLSSIDDTVRRALDDENYEICDMMKRVRTELTSKYIHSYF